jgi:hypothetical protein
MIRCVKIRAGNKQGEIKCLEFILQVLIIASSMPLMKMLRRQVNNLGLAIQSQEYSKNHAKD